MLVTVAHGDHVLRGVTFDVPGMGTYWSASRFWPWGKTVTGRLGEEHVHWIRGHVWAPWRRKELNALLTAAALAGPVAEPPAPAAVHPTVQARRLLADILQGVDNNVAKIMRDAERMVQDAERLVQTGRQGQNRRYSYSWSNRKT